MQINLNAHMYSGGIFLGAHIPRSYALLLHVCGCVRLVRLYQDVPCEVLGFSGLLMWLPTQRVGVKSHIAFAYDIMRTNTHAISNGAY